MFLLILRVILALLVKPDISLTTITLVTMVGGTRAIVFITNSPLLLYVAYEFSLIPIRLIIVLEGKYEGRATRVLVILTYTLIFSLPFLYILIQKGFLRVTFNQLFRPEEGAIILRS
jgi:NADH:ubiquinone oxidoreductase subunit 4 (subunit M)